MFSVGYAQEIFTPPVGVGLAGYFNARPNTGMYDDLYAKALIIDSNGRKFGFLTFDLLSLNKPLFDELEKRIVSKFGKDFHDSLILSATHTHTGPKFPQTHESMAEADELTLYAFEQTVSAAMHALERAVMNLQPGELEVGSVYNNPYAFVRRYWMKNGTLVTNPGWRNPNIDKPECDYDHSIHILKVIQGDRIAALLCNIANHGDTVGGNRVSADWYGRFTQEMQHQLKASIPVLVVDDASGNINHFDFQQQINQTSFAEATRIGRGYAAIVLGALDKLEPVTGDDVTVHNSTVVIPHRKITAEELADAKNTLATVPDIKKEGDFESQDLANKVPAALRYFAQRVIDCHEKSKPSHSCRITAIKIGRQVAFVTLPGEPFNGIASAIRDKSSCKYTFVIELSQSVSGYVPMPECFPRGGYEVQAGVDTVARNAASEIINASIANLSGTEKAL
ncbi:MAG: neutral/alkaline non-lysosomal ceramidase N-terminal domain-containing protein [Lentisphaeria bacterium]